MIYLGVVIDILGEEAEKELSAFPFLTLYQKKGNQLLGVIELQDFNAWGDIYEKLKKIPGFLDISILSSFCEIEG